LEKLPMKYKNVGIELNISDKEANEMVDNILKTFTTVQLVSNESAIVHYIDNRLRRRYPDKNWSANLATAAGIKLLLYNKMYSDHELND